MAGFYHLEILLLLTIVPLLYWYYIFHSKKRQKAAMQFSNISFLKNAVTGEKTVNRPRNLLILSLTAISLLIIGLADPHLPLEQTKEGVNVVLVIDTSGSMVAQDYQPNRLESAKQSAEKLINELDDKDYAGIVTFESGASSAAYLSPDKNRVKEKLKLITLKKGATAIGDGLALAIDMAESIPNRKKVVILLSDGVTNAGIISPQKATEYAKERDIQVFTIGMGSNEPVILGYDWFGQPQYASLDEDTLRYIADQTNGKYFRSFDDKTLKNIYENLNKEIKREKEETSVKDWFFFGALIIECAAILLRYGSRRIIP